MKGPRPRPVAERIREQIIRDTADCWIWQGGRVNSGYGRIGVGSLVDGTRRSTLVHRASYEAFVGPIPDGLEIDHLCRVKLCCNPAHLEPVTRQMNMDRRPSRAVTRCLRDHDLAVTGRWRMRNGERYRTCIVCERIQRAARRQQALADA